MERDPIIEEEYKIWKKNSPLIYDILISHTLEWPSLTFEWFPTYTLSHGKDYIIHPFIIGTYTNNEDQNKILIANVSIPNLKNPNLKQNQTEDPGSFKGPYAHISIKQEIFHSQEPNRIRYMIQNPNVIASKSTSGKVFLFDLTCHPSKPLPNSDPDPQQTLLGCEKEGYALAWSPSSEGTIISAGEEGAIFEWDTNKISSKGNFNFCNRYEVHDSGIEDVSWAKKDPNAFVSVGDDSKLVLWDRRNKLPAYVVDGAHKGDVNCVDLNYEEDLKICTGGADGFLKVWDSRNLKQAVNEIKGHDDEILCSKFSPFEKDVILTGGKDRRAYIFDLKLSGTEQSEEDAKDGAPEMIFCHGGHRDRISELSWSLNERDLVGSVSDDNILHIWKMVE